jgi:LysR family transcriptional activator of nhaA
MIDRLNYHHLYYFRIIATEGSISKAAQRLRLGQPTLSMQLKQFEEALGHELFERRNRTLVLTEMGRLVLGYANEIFRLGEELMDAVHDRPTQKKVRLQIGALDSIPKTVITQLMEYAYQNQECQISILEGEGPELISELVNHRLDLVLSNTPAPALASEKLFSKSLIKMPLVVVGHPRFESLAVNFPNSLENQPLIYPTSHSRVRHDLEQFFETLKILPNVIAETQDTSLMKNLALQGRGLVVIAEPVIQQFLKAGQLKVIGRMKDHSEELWLISAQRKLQNPVADLLMKSFTLRL